ncbi:hypothetical protein Hamer_G008152 [Homarus americanus]|uniref:Uncharacterized protein n=1 Tax=Homarus americanus TaxID=6706 RepID=A0A8J5NCJ8_HOMAM|nr:hypothetical protein Hamer_G008152 [Homarus americanus]
MGSLQNLARHEDVTLFMVEKPLILTNHQNVRPEITSAEQVQESSFIDFVHDEKSVSCCGSCLKQYRLIMLSRDLYGRYGYTGSR